MKPWWKYEIVVTGGAALEPETEKGFNDLGFDVEQGYGLTETAPVIAAETPKYLEDLALQERNFQVQK